MSLETFASSRAFTLGVELELQIVNRHDYDLTPGATDLLRVMERRKLAADVKPEITSSMIETSTGICERHHDVITQLTEVRDALVDAAGQLNVRLCGGGTHAFQDWSQRRIVDTPRYHQVSQLYGYLSKQFTVFGQHVHIGCPSPDEGLWLLHALSRFMPHVIALSASSPYIQGSDTGYESSRLNTVSAFPLSGRAPFLLTWDEFKVFFGKMERTGVVESMKDFYWDIRPKPEFGTIEVRVMDTPLTVEKAAAIAVYLQCVARWLLTEKPFQPQEDDYLAYSYNRFQACRFGLDGEVVDPQTAEHTPLRTLIAKTLQDVEMHAIELRAEKGLLLLRDQLTRDQPSDAGWLRATQQREQYLPEVVRQQCLRFEGVRTPAA
ncbi:YbdK family carboxylate-amine ligase [Aquincola sp. MAHUQ-54]|uniref:Putative glutamate--cysteine ligase 2 n=1 Tax=Aquincola agrisoli TaxID=3119538 RepID=A0AAW9QDC7_9BURK